MLILVILVEIAILWLLTRGLTSALYATTVILTRSRTLGVTVVTALLYPGTVLHELSHLLTATALGVRTGKMELTPEIPWRQLLEHKGFSMKTGSVDIERTDILRRTVVGMAPFIVGLTAVTLIALNLWLVLRSIWIRWNMGESIISLVYFWLILTYLIWAIGNTMFPSKSDVSGSSQLVFILLILIITVFAAGAHISGQLPALSMTTHPVMTPVAVSVGTVLGLDLVVIIVCQVILKTIVSMRRKI